jgi:Ser/Thr protein kinase RdoA (MazF antagonist)
MNDYNMLVDASTGEPRLSGIIDFGDMIDAPAVAELAIAGAYAVLGQERPVAALAALVAGYNGVRPLSDEELALIYPLVLTRLAVSVTNSAIVKREKPDDPYVTISEQPASFQPRARLGPLVPSRRVWTGRTSPFRCSDGLDCKPQRPVRPDVWPVPPWDPGHRPERRRSRIPAQSIRP